MKTLRNIITGIALLGGLAGCGEKREYMPQTETQINGYIVRASVGDIAPGMHIVIQENKDTLYKPLVFARDNDVDGRFDEIGLQNVPKGHPLEAYANLDSLEVMWNRAVAVDSLNKLYRGHK